MTATPATSGFQEYFGKTHQLVRRSMKEFVSKEVTPFIDDGEESGEIPLEMYRKAADVGNLGTGHPEEYGGTPGDIFFQIAVWKELMRAGFRWITFLARKTKGFTASWAIFRPSG